MQPLQGRVAVVTGSANNIGRATALMLSGQGAAVMVHAKQNQAGADETKALIEKAGGKAAVHLADLTTEAGAKSLMDATVAAFGRLDILINNAAVRRNTPFLEMTLEEFHYVMANSLDCAFLCARFAMPHMVAGKWGRIVNIGGITAARGTAGRVHVGAAKSAMIGMTRSLAREFGKDGVTVNIIAPGAVDTKRGTAAGARPKDAVDRDCVVGRDATVDEIAHMITMLCHPNGASTTGQTIHVNGGTYFN
ncbi:MAG: SDR family NAD(P)-dependent oxidoreductase [Hyphomicrobiaceae bacterium]